MTVGTFDQTALDRLRADFAGEIILPGDAAYDASRTIFNAMIDKRPAVIAQCATAADIAAAIRFGRECSLEIAVRGGGHGVAGKALTDGGVPAAELLALARLVVSARIAAAEGDLGAARAAFERAVAVQDALAYSEPPHWYYPVGQSLGAVLLRAGDLAAAEDAFRASLVRAPNNGWALFGLGEVYRRMGRADAAAELARRLDAAWAGDRALLDLSRL